MALLSLTIPLSPSCPKVAGSRNSSRHSSSTSVRKPPAMVAIPAPLRNYGGLFLRQSKRRSLQVVRMAPDEEKMTRRSPLDFPIDGSKGKEQKWTQEGSITESLPNGMFRIRLDNDDLIIGYVSGKIRQSFIRILPGDRVRVEGNRYDSTRGRIVYRLRNKSSKD